MAEVSVSGLSQLNDILNSLPEKIERNIVRAALRAGLKEMKQEAEARVPVKSGALRESLKVKTKINQGRPIAALTAGNKKAWYAHLVEFGTGSNYTGSGKSVGGPYKIKGKNGGALFFAGSAHPVKSVIHPGAKAQPFMRPAFDAGNRAGLEAFVATIRRRLTKQGIELPDEGDAS